MTSEEDTCMQCTVTHGEFIRGFGVALRLVGIRVQDIFARRTRGHTHAQTMLPLIP